MSLNLLDFDWVAEQSLNQSGNVMSRLTPQIPVTKMVKDERKPKQRNKQKNTKTNKKQTKTTHKKSKKHKKSSTTILYEKFITKDKNPLLFLFCPVFV